MFLGIAQFFVVVLASVVIGFVVGMVAAFISRFSEHVHGKYLLRVALSFLCILGLPLTYDSKLCSIIER